MPKSSPFSTCSLSFFAGTTLVDDLGPDGYGNKTCELIKAGDIGDVTYLEDNPKIHVWGRANEYLSERIAVFCVALNT